MWWQPFSQLGRGSGARRLPVSGGSATKLDGGGARPRFFRSWTEELSANTGWCPTTFAMHRAVRGWRGTMNQALFLPSIRRGSVSR